MKSLADFAEWFHPQKNYHNQSRLCRMSSASTKLPQLKWLLKLLALITTAMFFLFLFLINKSKTINTYFIKMLLKTILKICYNMYTGTDRTFERG